MPIILIDSVPGSGKSTLAEKLHKGLDIPVHYELGNPTTTKLLEKFYEDKKRWSFALQIHFLNERFRMIKDINKSPVGGILDRSIFGDRIFAEMLNEDGFMEDEEFETYTTLLDNMLEHSQKPRLLVYIDCNLDTALERIQMRGREMELEVPSEYWGRLNDKYSDWYRDYDISKKISIDANSYHPDSEEDIKKIVDLVQSELSSNYVGEY
jgi:deoxyadenosine/deoxycytidine kinase